MLKTLINAGGYTTGNIPSTVYLDTNDKYVFDSTTNTFKVRMAGLTEIRANVIVEATADGVLTLQLYADGNAIGGALSSQTVATGDTYTFNINDVIKTVYQQTNAFSELSLTFSGACTLVGGDIVLTYAR